jgi:hypothetical protein
MLITTSTTISFKLPEENALVDKFMSGIYVGEWSIKVDTNYLHFTSKTYSKTDVLIKVDDYENTEDK